MRRRRTMDENRVQPERQQLVQRRRTEWNPVLRLQPLDGGGRIAHQADHVHAFIHREQR
ncbi:hypothetical protein D3C71_2168950 [compost metagenome]